MISLFLYTASQNGHVEIARMLVDAGALIDKTTKKGRTPLSIASQNGYLEIVKILIDAGALINKTTKNGRTPLFLACPNSKITIQNTVETKIKELVSKDLTVEEEK